MKKIVLLCSFLLLSSNQIIMSKDYKLIPSNEVLKKPLPLPYVREEVNEQALLDFINKSRKGEQSIVIFGANWCPDCRILEATLELPTPRSYLKEHFSVIHVDLGKYDINMNLLEVLGIPRQEGVPRIVIFGENGIALNLDSTDKMRTARDTKQQDIFNYFQKYKLD